jgi:hypothetical protein
VHVWGRKSRSSVIKNRKSFHLVHVLSRQWRLINFRMHRSDDCRSWNFITNVNRWAHVSFWFWKKLHFLHFLPCKEIISCMFYLKDYQLQWIAFWLNLTKNWTKTLKSVIMNDTGPHLGKSKQKQEISEFKILVGTNTYRK